MLFTDASERGYGDFSCTRFSEKLCSGRFTSDEISTNRELLAVRHVFESFGNLVSGEAIQLNIDHLNASRILCIGSSKPRLHQIAMDILQHCLLYNIKLVTKWISRSQNTKADNLSKIIDTDNWSIDDKSFRNINAPSVLTEFQTNITKNYQELIQSFIVQKRKVLTLSPFTGMAKTIGCARQFP